MATAVAIIKTILARAAIYHRVEQARMRLTALSTFTINIDWTGETGR